MTTLWIIHLQVLGQDVNIKAAIDKERETIRIRNKILKKLKLEINTLDYDTGPMEPVEEKPTIKNIPKPQEQEADVRQPSKDPVLVIAEPICKYLIFCF